MKPVVFLGPTLGLAEARDLLDAVYLPPAAQGSVVSAVERYRPTAIGIIDGVFCQDLSVWHKEILYALEKGIRVFGGGSMGALRAVELQRYGMEGIGEIFQDYVDGIIEDDDEVALAHASGEDGYRSLSEPLVNIRATLKNGVAEGLISDELSARTIDVAKRMYFASRTSAGVIAELSRLGALPDDLRKVETLLLRHYVNVKRNDAIRVLEALNLHQGPAEHRIEIQATRSSAFRTLAEVDRTVTHGGTEIRLGDIFRHGIVNDETVADVRADAARRAVTVLFGEMLGFVVTSDEREEERRMFLQRRGLDATSLERWLAAHHLLQERFVALLDSLAMCRKVERWWLTNARRTSHGIGESLDELRLRGRYLALADAAVEQEQHLEAHGASDVWRPLSTSLRKAIEAHRAEHPVALGHPDHSVADCGLAEKELLIELRKASSVRNAPKPTSG